jgi:hypothetical protein
LSPSQLSLLGAFIVAALSGAVYLPWRYQLPPSVYQLLLLPFSFLLFGATWSYFKGGPSWALAYARRRSWTAWLSALGAVLLAAGLVSQIFQVAKFTGYGYAPNWPLLSAAYLSGIALFIWLGIKSEQRPQAWLAVILSCYAMVMASSIAWFPLKERSDMLLLLQDAGRAVLSGHWDQVYQSPPARVVTYLPGLWLSFLPATALGTDLRLISVLSTLIAVALAWDATSPQQRPLLCGLLCAWLLSPWFLFRHEAYVHAFWAFAGLACWGVVKRRPWAIITGSAWLACQSQIGWFVAPFMAAHLWKSRGPKFGLLAAGIMSATLCAVVLPVYLLQKDLFLHDTFGVWDLSKGLSADSPNTAWWASQALPQRLMRPALGMALLILFWRAWAHLAKPAEALRFCSWSLLIFITGNSPVRDYLFFTPCLFMIFWALAPAGAVDKEP